MDNVNSIKVPVTCDCGAKFEVPVAGLDLEKLTISCPDCGSQNKLTKAQIAQLVADHTAVVAALKKAFR